MGGMTDDEIVVTPEDEGDNESLLDRVRDMPVGTMDPNIVGDVGPTDVPPGTDPHGRGELVLEPDPNP
jgi:hypothetical protein